MDYETFGEHQWAESGIFDFLKALPEQWLQSDPENHTFMTLSEAIDFYEPVGEIDIPQTLTWADTERDLSAWNGNSMQQVPYKPYTPVLNRLKWQLDTRVCLAFSICKI